MAQVITFEDYTPIPRYDSIPWTDVQIEEGATSQGPWTIIDTLTLSPVDTDPANPQARDFTTELASDTPNLWYRITFVDGTGDTAQPTAPIQNTDASAPPAVPPCTPWVTGEDVAACCDAIENSGDPSVYDAAALVASQVLYQLVPLFSGECGPVTVRPCNPNAYCAPNPCGCCTLSTVLLSGYPVREIVEVLIDGAVIDPAGYRLDGRRRLVRLADENGRRQHWPGCQRLDLPDTAEGTFSVSYTYGADPPQLAMDAAVQLACQIAAFCPGGSGECELPAGTVSVTRQGVTIDLETFMDGGIQVLPLVALLIETYNLGRLRRRSGVYSPDIPVFARQVG